MSPFFLNINIYNENLTSTKYKKNEKKNISLFENGQVTEINNNTFFSK